jgi:flagellar biosynthesis protein FliR
MRVLIDTGWIVSVLLVAVRIGAALVMTPLLSFSGVPATTRVALVLVLAVTLVSAVALPPATALSSFGGLLAFGVFTAFAAFQLAGRVMDLQMGFGVASLIDPATRTQSPLLGTLLNLVALAVFFAVDGHHLVIRGLAYSLVQLPPGSSLAALEPAAVVAQFGAMFVFAVALAAPVIFVLLLVDVALAVMARTMPQMNVFIVSLPLKIMVGLLVLVMSIQYMGPVMARVFEGMFDYWQRVLG